jgi:hypothetical protein
MVSPRTALLAAFTLVLAVGAAYAVASVRRCRNSW